MAVFVVVLLQLLAGYFSPLATILGTIRPSLIDWIVICRTGLLIIGIVKVAKALFRFKGTRVFSLPLRNSSH